MHTPHMCANKERDIEIDEETDKEIERRHIPILKINSKYMKIN